jgi:hypothetical protein
MISRGGRLVAGILLEEAAAMSGDVEDWLLLAEEGEQKINSRDIFKRSNARMCRLLMAEKNSPTSSTLLV